MRTYQVKETAKSAYRGAKGVAVRFAANKEQWKIGDKHAKYFLLVFKKGYLAGKPLWFARSEIYT